MVQYIKDASCGCCYIVRSNRHPVSIHKPDLESILTARLSLAYRPTREELSVAIGDIHREYGHGPAAYAVADSFKRKWLVEKDTIKFILHDLWRDNLPGNPEDVWNQSAKEDIQMLHDFVYSQQEVV